MSQRSVKVLAGIHKLYIVFFFAYLAIPLILVALFAFNDAPYPALPWRGFTLEWFLGNKGVFQDERLMDGLKVSFSVASMVTFLCLLIGTLNAFLFERRSFPGKGILYFLMLAPLVVPGVILGVSILIFSHTLTNGIEGFLGIETEILRPGLLLVTLGQFAFITTVTTLVISARLRKFDRMQEEAAFDLGASHLHVLTTLTLPYLKPALISSGIVAFLMSFENFNTTFMLVGSDAPLTITLFDSLRQGATPVLNAVSVLLILASGVLVAISLFVQKVDYILDEHSK
ncbi:MAG: ABC transporter permease [Gammaproteobacteria bacterium]|nr:ABC transporter permease [Gammaproteobacteria bacterium]